MGERGLAGDYAPLAVAALPGRGGRPDAEGRWWRQLGKPERRRLGGSGAAVSHVAFCPARPHHLAATSGTRVVTYHGKTLKPKRQFSRFSDTAYCGAWRPDGKLLAAGGETGLVQVFDAESRTVLRVLKGHQKAVHAVAYGAPADNLHLASAGDDATVRHWDVAEGKAASTLVGHSDYIRALAGNPASPHTFASGSYDHTCRVWDVRQGGKAGIALDHGAPVEAVVVFPSGMVAATAGGNSVCVWDLLAGGRPLARMTNHQKTVTALQYVADAGPHSNRSARLLSAGLDGFVKVYELDEYRVTHSTKYQEPVLSLAVAPNCQAMALGFQGGAMGLRRAVLGTGAGEGAVDGAEGTGERRERWKPKLTAGSYRYFLRGQSEGPGADDLLLKRDRRVHLRPYDRALRKFMYREALDAALATGRIEVMYSVLETLVLRHALEPALANRDEEGLMPLMKVLCKYISDPRVSDLMCTVAHMVLDQYSGVVGQSKYFDKQLGILRERVACELRAQHTLMGLQGMADSILLSNVAATGTAATD